MSNKFLSLEEEVHFGEIIWDYNHNESTIYTEDEARIAQMRLIESNIKGAYACVHKYYRFHGCESYYDRKDACQDAVLALSHFIWYKYDPSKRCKVLSGAHAWIMKALNQESNRSRVIPMTEVGGYKYNQVAKYAQEWDDNKDNIQIKDKVQFISAMTNYKESEIIKMLNIREGISSMEYVVSDDSSNNIKFLKDLIEDEKSMEYYENAENISLLDSLLSNLSPIESLVIKYKFGLLPYQMELSEFCSKLKLTRKELNNIINEALSKLQEIAKQGEYIL